VIFQENVSFDHYFGTYPHAANLAGETPFHAKDDTPSVNGLESSGLLTHNPNSTQPFRLSPAQAVTCDQDHDYGDEQKAFHGGLMDLFPETVGAGGPGCYDAGKGKGLVMGYYDGNTVTALWNYAQHFAMSDNSFSTTFGPSTPGAVNLISGNTYGATLVPLAADGKTPGNPKDAISGGLNFGSVIGDPRPGYDNCLRTPVLGTAKSTRITMSGKNVGDLLTIKTSLGAGSREVLLRPAKTQMDRWPAHQCHPHHWCVHFETTFHIMSRFSTTSRPATLTICGPAL